MDLNIPGNLIGILHSDDVFFDNETLKNIASKYKKVNQT